MDKENIIDVDYTENTDNQIKGLDNIYYSTGQVAQMLGHTDSKIRYYCNYFESLLNLEIINKQRKFKKGDIEKLKYILELKEEAGMTRDQILQYCEEVSFDEKGIKINETNPLTIQSLAKALMEEQSKQLEEFKSSLLNVIEQKIESHLQHQANLNQENYERVKEEIVVTVDEVVSERLETHSKALQEDLNASSGIVLENHLNTITEHFEGIISEHNDKIVERDIQITKQLQEVLTNRKEDILKKSMNHQEPKGFFKRLFGK